MGPLSPKHLLIPAFDSQILVRFLQACVQTIRTSLTSPPLGLTYHLSQHMVCSRHDDSPDTPYSFIILHLHPWECQQPFMPGQLPQEHSKASLNVTALLQSSLRLSYWASLYCEHTELHTSLHSDQAHQHL